MDSYTIVCHQIIACREYFDHVTSACHHIPTALIPCI
jgi:hypothetical protein